MLRNIVLAVRAVFADVTVAPETDHTTAEFMRMRVKQTGITVTGDESVASYPSSRLRLALLARCLFSRTEMSDSLHMAA